MSLSDYVRRRHRPSRWTTARTRAIAGDVGPPYGGCRRRRCSIPHAGTSRSTSPGCGVTERFDSRSWSPATDKLGWSDVRYMRQRRPQRDAAVQSDLALIEEMRNGLRYRTLPGGVPGVDKRVEAEEGFAEELDQLRRADRRCGRTVGRADVQAAAGVKRRLAPRGASAAGERPLPAEVAPSARRPERGGRVGEDAAQYDARVRIHTDHPHAPQLKVAAAFSDHRPWPLRRWDPRRVRPRRS